MHLQDLPLAAWFVLPTHTGTEALAFILRWIHLLAGITWVGLLYFFILVNVPFMKQVDAGIKPKVFQYMTLPTLQWFRWSAMVTVFVGFWYWSQIYVAADARRMGVTPGSTIGFFLLIWIVTWGILYFVISRAPSGYLLGTITAIAVTAAAWLFVNYTPVGQDDNHVLSIGIGGGFGIIMLQPTPFLTLSVDSTGERGRIGTSGVSGLPHQFLSVGSDDIFHGRQFALHDIGTITGLSRLPSSYSKCLCTCPQRLWCGESGPTGTLT